MKILWVKTDFLHPTTRGGQIRTLEMLRRLHQRHEVHYVAFDHPASGDAVHRAQEYCSHAYPLQNGIPNKKSLGFLFKLGQGLFSPTPVVVDRYRSQAMTRQIEQLCRQHRFDSVVSDFLFPAANISRLEDCVLFQHNVETLIWRRHAEHGSTPLHRFYFRGQAQRMLDYEKQVCARVRRVIAVSRPDAELMQSLFGVDHVAHVPTGVDTAFFSPVSAMPKTTDLVFVGSMDWMPNIDGIKYFVADILPLIRRGRPNCSVAIVGRQPAQEVLDLAKRDPQLQVTGTVPDVRPYLWQSKLSIVPLRIGGGTRLKIYESLAAKVPVVSTSVGAEGLDVTSPGDIRIADTPEDFANQCLHLLEDDHGRARLAEDGWHLTRTRFSWDEVTKSFEQHLQC